MPDSTRGSLHVQAATRRTLGAAQRMPKAVGEGGTAGCLQLSLLSLLVSKVDSEGVKGDGDSGRGAAVGASCHCMNNRTGSAWAVGTGQAVTVWQVAIPAIAT